MPLYEDSATNDLPLIIDRKIYDAPLKYPLYGRLAKIGVEIGGIIVKETSEETFKDLSAILPEGSCSLNQPKKRSSASLSKEKARTLPGGSEVPRLVYCENCGTANVHRAKFCYICGARLRSDTDAVSDITMR